MFEKKDDDKQKSNLNDIEMVILKTVVDNYDLNIVRNLLEEQDIPYILNEKGPGGYMKIISGSSLYGTDILVENSQFEKAKAILDEFSWKD